jgi:hypothetical protein
MMKKLSLENRKKLKTFLEQSENLTAIVFLCTMFSYLILFTITKNMFVLLFRLYVLLCDVHEIIQIHLQSNVCYTS